MAFSRRTVEGDYVVFERDVPTPSPPTSNSTYAIVAGVVIGILLLGALLLACFYIRRHNRRVAQDRTGFDILVETKPNRQSMLNTGMSVPYPIVPSPPVPLLAPAPSFRSFSSKRGPPRPRHNVYGHSRSGTNSSVSTIDSDSIDMTRDVMTEMNSHYITIDTHNLDGATIGGNGERRQAGGRSGVGGSPIYRQPTIDQGPPNGGSSQGHLSSSMPYDNTSKSDHRRSDVTIRAYNPSSGMYDGVVQRTQPSTYQPPSRNRSPGGEPTGDPDPDPDPDPGLRRGRTRMRRSSIPYPQPVAIAEPPNIYDPIPRGLAPATRRSGIPRAPADSPPRDPSRPVAVFSPATAKEDKPFNLTPKPSIGRSSLGPAPKFTVVIDSPDTVRVDGTMRSRHDVDQT